MTTRMVERGGMLYIQSFAPQPALDVKAQTKQVLERIEELLAAAGASKSSLLTARVLLSDMALFADYDSVWNEWVDPRRRPLRVCKLADPGLTNRLIDITVTAAKST